MAVRLPHHSNYFSKVTYFYRALERSHILSASFGFAAVFGCRRKKFAFLFKLSTNQKSIQRNPAKRENTQKSNNVRRRKAYLLITSLIDFAFIRSLAADAYSKEGAAAMTQCLYSYATFFAGLKVYPL